MGILPLQFVAGQNRKTLQLSGTETFNITGIDKGLAPRCELTVECIRANNQKETFKVLCRIDTANELEYYKNGGILHYVLRKLKG